MLALESHLEPAKLDVVCAEVWRAANGNIRLWQHYRIHVLVELVDPTEGVIGGDDIEEAPATLDLRTGAIELDSPKRGYPMLNWAHCGATIIFCGERYSCFIQRDNLPSGERCWGSDVVEFIEKNGYHAVLDLMTLEHSGPALSSF
ncbi:hypothetical protein [Duganella vulcania]|uniref:Uncharacterized protein n=1 Tax=Duganella vulcania TaxID=2692166 RepID=A0A845GFN2_9BURK|nr:hypothetical protein [Duganella vulcania]MYM92310.1 hypothetical protein [Duganella vulcania]